MTPSQNKEIVENFLIKTWQQGNLQRARDFLSPLCIFHAEGLKKGDVDEWQQAVADFLAAHPQYIQVQIDDMIAEGDKVAVRWTGKARRGSTIRQDPTAGEEVTYSVMANYQLAGGKIEHAWVLFSEFGNGAS